MEENNFDLKMRSMLESGQEEVPAGLWSAIESRLPAASSTVKAPVIWWRWACGATAIAAAVALTLIFAFRNDATPSVDIENVGAPVLAEVTEEENAALEEATAEIAPVTATKAIAAADKDVKAETVIVPETVVVPEAVEDEAVSEQVSEKTDPEKDWLAAYETEDFNENGTELKEKKEFDRHVKLAAYGDATSNTNPTSGSGNAAMMKKPTTPTITSIEETGESTYGIPVAAGVGIKIPVANRVSIGTGINWSMMTRNFSGQYNQVDEDGNVTSQASYSSIRNTQHYLGVPVNVYYSIINKDFVDFYAYAGGSANKCLTNRYTMHGLDGNINYKSPDTGWQFSTGAGIGVEFIVAKRFGFYIDPSVNYWFGTKNSANNLRTRQPFMMGLEMGMRIRL